MGRPPLSVLHVASLEGGFLPCPPQAPVPTPSFWGWQTPWWCPHGDPNCLVPTINRIGEALENLAFAGLNDTTVLQQQQLTAANLALTVLVTSLTAANKKLANALPRNKGSTAPARLELRRRHWRHRRLARQPGLSQATVAGPMVTGSIRPIQVQPAFAGRRDTRRTRQPPTQWAVAKQTRDGTPTPYGV